MDTEEKKLTSSEIEEMLKEAEAVHQSRRVSTNRQQNRKKKPRVRIDMIIAAVVAVAVIISAVVFISNITKDKKPGANKVVTENPLMDEKYPEISDVVKNYLNAYLIPNSAKRLSILAQYVDNMGAINESDISQNKYVESYSDIECYTKNGPYENTYVVYAYYQMEIKNIAETVPVITTLYVIRDANTGNVYIHNGISSDVEEYISDISKDADVQELLNDVNKEFQETLDSSDALKEFFGKMEEANKPIETETGKE